VTSDTNINKNGISGVATIVRATAEIEYISVDPGVWATYAQAGVYLDYNSKNQRILEDLTLTDLASIGETRVLSDGAIITDESIILTSVNLDSEVTLTEYLFPIVSYNRIFREYLNASDNYTPSSSTLNSQSLNEYPINFSAPSPPIIVFTATDVGLNLPSNNISTSDNSTVSAALNISDEVVVSEVITTVVNYNRILNDYVYPDDSSVHTFGELNSRLLNSYPINDTEIRITLPVFTAIGVNPTDTFSLSEIATADFNKPLVDSTTINDAINASILPTYSDAFTLSDTLSPTVSYSRDFSETATVGEDISINVGRNNLLLAFVTVTDDATVNLYTATTLNETTLNTYSLN
jgi:hypothetical protein